MIRALRNRTNQLNWGNWMRHGLLGVLTVLVLTACNRSLLLPSGADSGSFNVGANQIGESCRAVGAAAEPGVTGVLSTQNVMCGNWEKASAKILVTGKDKSAMELATSGWWRERLDMFASCGPPFATSILDGVQAVAMDCQLRSGGWPYQALAVSINGKIYLGDSIPAAYPVMERSIGVLSGQLAKSQALERGTVSSEIKRLEATLAKANYSAGDLSLYRNLLRLAQYYNFLGNFAEAERCYVQALELQQKLLPGGGGDQCFLYMHIGLELSNQERFNIAEAMFERAQSLLQQSVEPAADEARLLGYRAIDMANRHKNKEALDLARGATALRRELAGQYGPSAGGASRQGSQLRGQRQPAVARTSHSQKAATAFGDLIQSLSLEAAMLMELKQLEAADRVITDASNILDQEPRLPRRWLAQVRLLQAWSAELRGDWPRAENLLLATIDIQRSLFSESRTESMAYLALGRVYAAEGRPDQALDAFRKGFDIINRTHFSIGLEEAIPFFRISVEDAGRNPEQRERVFSDMFEVAQSIRGTTVAQTMAMTMARLASGMDEIGQLIRNLQDARYERDKAREELYLAQADPKSLSVQLAELEQDLAALNSKIADLERQVQSAAPNYNQLLDQKVPARDVLAALRPHEALAQILLGRDSSFVFFADADGISAYEVELNEQHAGVLVSKMRNAVEATDQLRTFPVGDAYNLYEKLFGPVKDRLAKANHFIIVPSGPLLSLPFGVLVVEPPGHFSRAYYSEVAWMAIRQGLTVAPSVQSFANLRSTAQPSKASSSFIGFGDFSPHSDSVDAVLKSLDMPETCRAEAAQFASATRERLPNSAGELRQVATALGAPESSLVLGDSFSLATVQKTVLDKYRIIYFSTHGLLPSKLKCFREPALVVSKPPDARSNGLLTSSEIAELRLDADLVVLSACDTGGPEGQAGGESLSGLARSFLYAGARSLLVTHWAILEKPSTELLITSFKRLGSENVSLAEALRDGQAALIENPNTSHPMIWGAFTIVGDGGQHMGGLKLASY
jgi:CHAT domain-containing protein